MPGQKRARTGLSIVTAPGRRVQRTFRKRVAKRRFVRSKRGRLLPSYSFHRWVTSLSGISITHCTYDVATSILTHTTGNPTAAASFSFSLQDIPNVSEFTTLFDSYMITGVMFQIKMINNPNSLQVPNVAGATANGQTATWYPTLWYVPDHDDNANITLTQIKEYEKVRHKVFLPNREINIMLRPTTLTQLYRTATTTGYSENRKRTWLDIAASDIPHYGLKFLIDFEGLSPVATSPYTFKINAKFYFKCRNVR